MKKASCKTTLLRSTRLILTASFCLVASKLSLWAASGTWTNLNGGNWSVAANWLNGVVADGAGNTADFNSIDLQATTTVVLDSPRTIGAITFGDTDTNTPNGWIISNGGVAANSLTLSNASATPLITVNPIHGLDGINNSNDVIFAAIITGQQGWTKKGFGCLTPTITNAVNLAGPVQIDEGLIDLQQPTALAQGRNLIFNGGALAGSVTAQPVTLTNIILTTATEISSNSYTATRVNFGAVPFIGGPASVLRFAINQEVVVGGTLPAGSNCFANFSGTVDFGNSTGNWRQDPGNGGGVFGSKTATFNLGTNTTFINSRAATAGAFHTHILGALIGGPRTQLRGSQQTANALVIYQIGDANLDTTFDGTIRDGAVSGGAATYVVKSGSGRLTLTGTNTFTGTTVINSGALVLGITELMNSTPSITINSNGVLDVSAFTSGWANLQPAQTLAGNGTVTGSVIVASGFVSPGVGTNIGLLKFAGDYTVTGTMSNVFKIGSGTNDSLLVSGNLILSNQTATIRVVPTGSVINNGLYPLVRWTGNLTGDTNNVVLSYPPQPGTLTLVTNLATKTISLNVSGASVNNLTWSGNVSANNWDHATHNWNSGTLPFTDLDNVTFNDSGVASVPVNILENVNAGSITVNNTNKDYIFNSSAAVLTGNNGLTKSGPGKLTLIGMDNTYAGITTVNAGTVQLGDGAANAGMVGTGGIIDNGTLIFYRPVASDLTLGSQITGSGTLVQNGTNVLTLTANNGFAGATVINAGTLQLGDGTSANGSIGGTVSNNATLNYSYNNTANINNSFVGTGVVNFAVSGGTARQFNLGSTPTSLTNNGFSGTINVGPLVALHVPDQANGTNQLGWNSTVVVQSTAQLTLDRNSYCNSTLYLSGSGNGAGITGNMAMDIAQGAVMAGNIILSGDATIGGFLGDVTVSGRVLGQAGGETLTFRNTRANATSINIRIGSTNGPNNWGPTIIDPGDNLNQIIRVTAMTSGAISTNALTVNAHGVLQLNGNNLTVASLASGSPDGSFNATILNAATNAPATLTVGTDGTSSSYGGIFGDGASKSLGLTKVGAGTLTLSAVNTNTGTVAVNGGTLALTGSGSFGNSAVISIASGATYDVSGAGGTLTLNSGQTLMGYGGVNGNLSASAGSTISPGGSIGTLSVTGNVALAGTVLMELNRANSPTTNDLLVATGTLTGGGTLTVTNIGPALHTNDSFQLFSGAVTGFSTINLQTLDTVNNVQYTWNNTLGSDGKISVASVSTLVNPNPTNITVSVTSSNLALSWPSDHTGWTLQSQTNSLSVGLGTNWVDVSGSAATNLVNIPIDKTKGSVFFRMKH